MKRKFFTTAALLFCFVVCFAFVATDISGKWVGSIKGQDGNNFDLSYTFKVDGDKLTGSITSPRGETTISDGKVNGSDFSFTVSVNGSDIKNVGKYYAAADSAGIDVNFGGNNFHIPLKRSTK